MRAEQVTDSTARLEAEFPDPSAEGETALRMCVDASRNLAEELAAGQGEMMSFWQARLECWGDAASRLAACREPEEALRIQAEFVRDRGCGA
jgi:hypothetical protein